MPAALEACVASMTAKWKKDPKSRPASKEKNQDAKAQAFAICTATLKRAGKMSDVEYAQALLSQGDGDMAGRIAMLEDLGHDREKAIELAVEAREAGKPKVSGLGPALLGAALTIRPFIKRQERATVVEDGDKKTMRIPLMRKGSWRHPLYGILRFDDTFFNSIQRNFNDNVVGQELPVKGTHVKDQAALGWITKVELDDKGNFIVSADPTGDEGPALISSRKMPYASAEFTFDYRDREMKTLSFADMEEVDLDETDGVYQFSDAELEFIENQGCMCQEDNMGETTKDVVQLSAEELAGMQERLAQLAELSETVKSLQGEVTKRDEQLEAERERIAELETINELALAEAIMERARNYRDNEGRGHSAVFLAALDAGLRGKSLSFGEEVVVEMSDEVSVDSVREYYIGVLRYLAENQPGSVPQDGHTQGVDDRELGGKENVEELGAGLWDDTHKF